MATAYYLEDVFAALAHVVNAACPEITVIEEAEHASTIPWEKQAPPFAVILIDDLPSTTEWGATNDVYSPIVEIYYVAEVRGPVSPVRHGLERLRDKFLKYPNMGFQMMGIAGMKWSDDLEPNRLFVSKNMPHRAGRLLVSIVFGTTLPPLDAPY